MSHESETTVALTPSLDYINLGLLRRSIGAIYQERGERIQPRLCKVFMDMAECKADAANMIEAALDWTKRMRNAWWYKSAEEWEQEINISSNHGAKRGREALKQAGFEVKKRTMPGTNGMCRVYHYRLNIEVFLRRFAGALKVTFEKLIEVIKNLKIADQDTESEQVAEMQVPNQQKCETLPSEMQVPARNSAEHHPYLNSSVLPSSSIPSDSDQEQPVGTPEQETETDSDDEEILLLKDEGFNDSDAKRFAKLRTADEIRRMIANATDAENPGGWLRLALEHGYEKPTQRRKSTAQSLIVQQVNQDDTFPDLPPVAELPPECEEPAEWAMIRRQIELQYPNVGWINAVHVVEMDEARVVLGLPEYAHKQAIRFERLLQNMVAATCKGDPVLQLEVYT